MKVIPLITCILLVTGGVTAQQMEIRQFEWLLGTWKMETTKGTLLETWTAESDTTMVGRSIRVKTGDTLLLERIRIVCNRSGCAYIPIAEGQNNNKPVVFRMTTISQNGFVAENPAHDFPKRIQYDRDSERLNASVSGNGKENKFPFVLAK